MLFKLFNASSDIFIPGTLLGRQKQPFNLFPGPGGLAKEFKAGADGRIRVEATDIDLFAQVLPPVMIDQKTHDFFQGYPVQRVFVILFFYHDERKLTTTAKKNKSVLGLNSYKGVINHIVETCLGKNLNEFLLVVRFYGDGKKNPEGFILEQCRVLRPVNITAIGSFIYNMSLDLLYICDRLTIGIFFSAKKPIPVTIKGQAAESQQ